MKRNNNNIIVSKEHLQEGVDIITSNPLKYKEHFQTVVSEYTESEEDRPSMEYCTACDILTHVLFYDVLGMDKDTDSRSFLITDNEEDTYKPYALQIIPSLR